VLVLVLVVEISLCTTVMM